MTVSRSTLNLTGRPMTVSGRALEVKECHFTVSKKGLEPKNKSNHSCNLSELRHFLTDLQNTFGLKLVKEMGSTEDKEWKEFVAKMGQLSLPELEELIKEQFKVFQKSRNRKDRKLDMCLDHRKYLINSNFKFTPEAVSHIERINRILTESTAKILKRSRLLYGQMVQLKQQGDDFLDDFNVDGSVSASFNGEASVLILDEDENNGQSDYIIMAEILNYTLLAFENLRVFYFSYDGSPESREIDEDRFKDDMLELNWNIELLSASELSSIDYFCYASHILFVDSKYSISDAIRVNDIWNEVKVTHQNWGEKRSIP